MSGCIIPSHNYINFLKGFTARWQNYLRVKMTEEKKGGFFFSCLLYCKKISKRSHTCMKICYSLWAVKLLIHSKRDCRGFSRSLIRFVEWQSIFCFSNFYIRKKMSNNPIYKMYNYSAYQIWPTLITCKYNKVTNLSQKISTAVINIWYTPPLK